MKVTSQDVFAAFYRAFHDLEKLNPAEDNPEAIEAAQKEVEVKLDECSKLLDRYIDARVWLQFRKAGLRP